MVIQRTVVGFKRVELQTHPIILPTVTLAVLSIGRKQMLSNATALKFAVLSWDGHDLVKITGAAAYKGAFAQYQTRVQIEFDIDVPDQAIFGA